MLRLLKTGAAADDEDEANDDDEEEDWESFPLTPPRVRDPW